MGNYITSNGTFNMNVSGQNLPLGTSISNLIITGSNVVMDFANVAIGATGTTLLSQSLSTYRYGYFSNESTSSCVIYIFPSIAQTTPICILQPGDFAVIPHSASMASVPYYAYASGSNGLLEYALINY